MRHCLKIKGKKRRSEARCFPSKNVTTHSTLVATIKKNKKPTLLKKISTYSAYGRFTIWGEGMGLGIGKALGSGFNNTKKGNK